MLGRRRAGLMLSDFVYLNVPALLSRYENPSPDWEDKVRSLARTQISFFYENQLVSSGSKALSVPIDLAILKFSDFTAEGAAFVRSQAVERWLTACDRKGTVDAYKDGSGLIRRLARFRQRQRA